MKKALIHQSPEERLANSSNDTLSATQKTNQLLQELRDKETPKEVNMKLTNQPNELATAFFSMLKGEKGDAPTDEELLSLIRPLIPKAIPGPKGDSIKGDKPTANEILALVRPLIPKPIAGKTPTKEEVVALIKPLIPEPIKGKDGSPDTPDQVVSKVNSSVKFIQPERVKGLTKIISEVEKYGTNPGGSVGGGRTVRYLDSGSEISAHVTELNFGTGFTPTYDGEGRISLTVASGVSDFVSLTDTPSSFTGQALKILQVNAGETALEFVALVGGGNALTTNPLSQFAATTKAQLDGVISDGNVMYIGDAPTAHTHTAANITDFDTAVAANSAVAANTAKVSYTDAAKVAGIEASADVTDTANVTAAGALMDSEVTNLAQVKAFDTTDYATAAQGATADTALQPTDVGSNLTLARIAGSTYSTVQHLQDTFHSAGWVSGGVINDVTAGNITVDAGAGYVRATDSPVAQLVFANWTALASTAIPSNTTRYVGVEYNAGAPRAIVHTTYDWDFNTNFPLGKVVNEGGVLHIENAPHDVGDHASNMIERVYETMGIQRDNKTGGLILSETGTRNIAVSAGRLWERLTDFSVSATDTSVTGSFDAYYDDGASGFTKEASRTTWNNTQYDDGTGTLATLAANKYSVQWFYMSLDGDLMMRYGGTYNSAAAAEEEAAPATNPDRISNLSILIGRVVFKKSDASALEVQSSFTTTFQATLAADHSNLSNLQGGTAGEYYHATAAEYTVLGNTSGTNTGDEVAASTTVAGVIELATDAEMTTGTATDRAITPANAKVELDKKAPTASPTFTGTVSLPADSVNAITEIASAIKTGSDAKLVTGTAGTAGNIATWDANGDIIDSGVAPATLTSTINFVIDGGGSAITTGIKGDIQIDFACTIDSVTLLADQSGSIVVDIWNDTYANYPATDADSITASAVPTITTATKSTDATLTGWTKTISAGDILRFNVDSITTCQRVTLALKVTRT